MVETGTQRPLPGELKLAAGLIFFAAVPIALIAVMTVGEGGLALTASSLGPLAVGLALTWLGVDVLRRRHLAFCILVPAVLAVACLAYAVGPSSAAGLWAAAYWGAVVALVVSKRRHFWD